MAAKIKINDHGDCIFTEQDAIDLLYTCLLYTSDAADE